MSKEALTDELYLDYLDPDADPKVEYQKWKEQGGKQGFTLKHFQDHFQSLRIAAKECLEEELCDGEQDDAIKAAIWEYDGPLGDFSAAEKAILEEVEGILLQG